jgi:hypothetical protein
LENLKGINYLKDLGTDEKIMLMWILKTVCDDVDWMHLAQNKPCGRHYDHGREPSGLIIRTEIFDQLNNS